MIDLNLILVQVNGVLRIPLRRTLQFHASGANEFKSLRARTVAQLGERTRQTDPTRMHRFHLLNATRGRRSNAVPFHHDFCTPPSPFLRDLRGSTVLAVAVLA